MGQLTLEDQRRGARAVGEISVQHFFYQYYLQFTKLLGSVRKALVYDYSVHESV